MNIIEFQKNYYFIKNFYFMESYLEFKNNINLNSKNKQFNSLINNELFVLSKDGIKVSFNKTSSRKDYYAIEINYKNEINITYSTKRSLRYAYKVLEDLTDNDGEKILLPFCYIEDEASFIKRGIIEGYYGTPWSFENRIDMIEFMDNNRLNTYMYAPKMDSYHRDKWYELYPNKEINELKYLHDRMKEKNIDFYYCISPGHAPKGEEGFVYVGERDFERLYKKLDQLIDIGVTSFGLLLDDIDYNLKGQNLEIFKRPGLAHSHICNKVYSYLKTKVKDLNFVMCPTEYHEIGESQYRLDLKNELNKDIEIYWTGDNVCAEMINDNHTKTTKKAFGHELIIWENFPVSDFTYGVREFIAPIKNRSVDLCTLTKGYMINPSVCYEISKLSMITEAHYAWNSYKYNPSLSFEIALNYHGSDFYKDSYDYIMYNYPNVLSYGDISYERKLVDENDINGIINYYNKVVTSCKKMLTYKIKLIDELNPWLERTIEEAKIVQNILQNQISKEELVEFYGNIKFSGSELLDYLVLKKQLLNDAEYEMLIKKRRGNPWYRVWEHKRKNVNYEK